MGQTAESTSGALAGSRELLETILRHLRDGIVVTAASGERLYANDEAARLTGYATAPELLEAGLMEATQRFQILHSDGRPLDPTELPARRALAGEEPEPMLVRFRAAEGGPDRISLVRAVPVRDGEGALRYVISIFREVTAERVLSERERVSAGAAEVLNATLDYDGILNAIARFAVSELADGCAVDVLDDTGELRRAASAGSVSLDSSISARVVAGAEPHLGGSSLCVPLVTGGNRRGAILLEAKTRSYDANDLRIAREIASRAVSAIENALLYEDARRTSALLDSLYESAPIGLGFWDCNLRYVRVNDALARINDRPAADHIGRTLDEVIPELAPVIEPVARRVLETRTAVVALQVTGGTQAAPNVARHWLASYYPVLAPDGETLGVGALVEEITDRRRAEQRSELQYAVTRILADAETSDAAVPLVLETVCEALGWDVAAYWPCDEGRQRVVWTRPGAHLPGFRAMTEQVPMREGTLAWHVVETGSAEWLEELSPDRFARASIAAAEGIRSGVGFPILVGGRAVGVLEAFSSVPRERDDELLELLNALGAQLGQFLSRKRAEEERAELLDRERQARAVAEAAATTLRKLERVSQAALEHLTLDDLLQALLERIAEVLDADTAAILLVGTDGLLTIRADVGLGSALEGAVSIPFGAGLAGRVAASRAPLLVPDLSQVELVSPVLRARGVNSLAAIPLLADNRVIGVLHVGSEAFAQFDESDVRLLELIADRIALAINQAWLYEAERAAQERLRFMSEASIVLASSLDLEVTLRRAAELAITRFADAAVIDLVDGDSIARVVIEIADPRISGVIRQGLLANPPVPGDTGGSAKVIRTGEPEIFLDLEADPTPLQDVTRGRPAITPTVDLLKPRSLVYMPLIARGHTLGVLALIRTTARFDQADVDTVRELAARVAVAVDNANLYREARRGREQLGFLAEASALLGSTLEVEGTLDELCSLVAGRAADWCAVHLRDDTGRIHAASVAHRDLDRTKTARSELAAFPSTREPPTMVSRAIETGEPVLISNGEDSFSEHGFEREEGVHSGMVIPLVARGRPLGSLSLVRAETVERYTPEDLEFAVDLARRAAIALDNAQLYRASEERAQAARVLASVGDGVFFVDRHGLVRTWNRAAASATGISAAGVTDRLAVDAIPGWAAIASRIPLTSEGAAAPRPESLPLDLGGRELWLSIHGVEVPDGIVYAFRDLTEERALEAMRTEFVSTVSHELRTPLAAIYGAAMTLRREDVTLAEEQRANLLDVVSAEADRLARTVNDILWASRLDTDSLRVSIQNCDPRSLAHDVVEAQRAHLGRAHEIVLLADPDLPAVTGDPDKVGRVLINLVDNAVKYSPDGGSVTVTVTAVGSHVRFLVKDEGLGIPSSEQRRIFDKFYRLDPNMNRGVGGTGLGLYICRELVRRMDGRIWVSSEGLGTGSTFAVELPAAGDFAAHIS